MKTKLVVDIFRQDIAENKPDSFGETPDEPEPSDRELKLWTEHAFTLSPKKIKTPPIETPISVSLALLDDREITALNQKYRQKDGPTNVLSFPAQAEEIAGETSIEQPYLLGDIVFCSRLIHQEALEQSKQCKDHWAHLTVHGMLHLLGYDHIVEADAQEMEALEIDLLSQLKIKNPYHISYQET